MNAAFDNIRETLDEVFWIVIIPLGSLLTVGGMCIFMTHNSAQKQERLQAEQCSARWERSEYKTRYESLSGCLVETKAGVYYPESKVKISP